jgi:hypothetical protein
VSFPALTLALGYLPTRALVALATLTAGAAVVAGAALAARGRGDSMRGSARAWATAYAAGVLVYLTGLEVQWPQPDTAVIVTADGSPGLSGDQKSLLLLLSIAVTLVLGAALDRGHRAAAAWAVAMLPLPILIVFSAYATSILGNAIRFGGQTPAHLVGLICSGGLMGLAVGAAAEGLMRGLTPPVVRSG